MTDDDLQLEHGFLKAPWEVLMRSFRTAHKAVIKDAESIAESTAALTAEARTQTRQGGGHVDVPTERVDALISRVQSLQQRLEAARADDRRRLDTCLARIEHLGRRRQSSFDAFSPEQPASATATTTPTSEPSTPQTPPVRPPPQTAPPNGNAHVHPLKQRQAAAAAEAAAAISTRTEGEAGGADGDGNTEALARWEKTRLDRVLVDYMLRSGLYASGALLAESERISALVDTTIFQEARRVIAALRARDCSAALNWCAENKRRLAKAASTLEFQLHRQVCIEYARAGDKLRAIEYARQFLSTGTISSERHDEIGSIMTLIVFTPGTDCQPYKNMYAEHKWLELEEKFKQENYRLHGLTPESTLEILLKAGLSALKTRKCGGEGECEGASSNAEPPNPNCPVCNEPYRTLAQRLPRGQHVNSVLVCAISGAIMDENNPPMAMPNGNVYSYNALQDLALHNDNLVTDPKTGKHFAFSSLRKCYIM